MCSQPWGLWNGGQACRVSREEQRKGSALAPGVRSVHSGKKMWPGTEFRDSVVAPDEQLWRGGRRGPLGRHLGAGEAREDPCRSACEQTLRGRAPGELRLWGRGLEEEAGVSAAQTTCWNLVREEWELRRA